MSLAPVPAPTEIAPAVEVPPALVEKLAEPGVAEALTSLLSHADLVAILVEGLDGLVGRGEEISDSLSEGISELHTAAGQSGSPLAALGLADVDLAALARSLVSFASAAPALSSAVNALPADDLAALAAGTQPMIRGITRGNEAYASQPVAVGGALSALRLFKDPDINRTITYVATIAKAIGQELSKTTDH